MKEQAVRKQTEWIKDEKEPGLYRYGQTYYARVKVKGKQKTRSLCTHDRALARRLLAQFRVEQASLDHTVADPSLAALCERYAEKFEHQKPKTIEAKKLTLQRIRDWWPTGAAATSVSKIRESHCDAWLAIVARRAKSFGPTSRNGYIEFLKSLFAYAARNRWILASPATNLERTRRAKPIRRTPTFEQFTAIVASIREQKFADTAEESADFVEVLGLAGLGQAEASSLTWGDLNWSHNTITTFRHKTETGFEIPLYPQLRPLLEKRFGAGQPGRKKIFTVRDAKKALAAACRRLDLPLFSQRSLRRMFVTRAIERGVDVKVIADWQGHKDGGKLILDTYSLVRAVHSQRMARLMTTDEPENVIPMNATAAAATEA
jgi:integrase